jgi:phosphatidylglycerophosphate synthase
MSKLAVKDRFFDCSDYGRPLAVFIAQSLKNTHFTPIHVTYAFGVSGLMAIFCIFHEYYVTAGFFLILKSVLDAADGELSRVKNTPSHAGRYLDSIFDIILNFLFLVAIGMMSDHSFIWIIIAFVSIQIQGTLYNYYYVIVRNKSIGGDQTSKIFEQKSPKALPGESQQTVDRLFFIFYLLYSVFDKLVFWMDQVAYKVKAYPNWFMTLVSLYGLGFQLLLIAVMLSFGMIQYIIPFFMYYNVLIIFILATIKSFMKVK